MKTKNIKNVDLKQAQKSTKAQMTSPQQKLEKNVQQHSNKKQQNPNDKSIIRINPKQTQSKMISSRSNPNLLTSTNYIKMEEVDQRCLQQVFSKVIKPQNKIQKLRSLDSISELDNKFLQIQKQETEATQKKPKFKRKNVESKEFALVFPVNNSVNLYNSQKKSVDLMNQNFILKKQVQDLYKKNQQLNNKIKLLTPQYHSDKIKSLQKTLKEHEKQLDKKNSQIKQLQQRNKNNEKKIQELMAQKQMFHKIQQCSLDLDGSGIGGDILSTAEYIESLTDLEDQIHQRKSEIFGLNKIIDQLQIKQRFTQLRHEQNIQRLNQEWDCKYKKLIQMYRTLKQSKESNNKMSKLKSRTQYIDCQKEELFNLSLSTDRSHMPM